MKPKGLSTVPAFRKVHSQVKDLLIKARTWLPPHLPGAGLTPPTLCLTQHSKTFLPHHPVKSSLLAPLLSQAPGCPVPNSTEVPAPTPQAGVPRRPQGPPATPQGPSTTAPHWGSGARPQAAVPPRTPGAPLQPALGSAPAQPLPRRPRPAHPPASRGPVHRQRARRLQLPADRLLRPAALSDQQRVSCRERKNGARGARHAGKCSLPLRAPF